MKLYWMISSVLFFYFHSFAQTDDPLLVESRAAGSSFLTVGLESSTTPYIDTRSNDSSGTLIYLAPSVYYVHSSGFGVDATAFGWPGGSNPGFYRSALTAFYGSFRGKWMPYISYTRHISHQNPAALYSPISNEIFGRVKLHTSWIDYGGGLDWGFGEDSVSKETVHELAVFFSVSHYFSWNSQGGAAWIFQPLVRLNAGTNQYFNYMRSTRYLSQGRTAKSMGFGSGGNGRGYGGSGMESMLVSETSSVELNNIEFNGRLIVNMGRFTWGPSGSLFMPLRSGDDWWGYWQVNLNYYLVE